MGTSNESDNNKKKSAGGGGSAKRLYLFKPLKIKLKHTKNNYFRKNWDHSK